ncbi:hypothetical protein CEV34_2242 [Brucella pseudogrignonensis]|uniref:Uncharacterized protein n=1 Tax=Brucella pseudogrignonensis TaxID=419475 RepID=A0A256GH90_9HYPH|nr:hypothetical protein CEV34_2242 [Brucella pseudogrignonensis]
MFRAVKAGLPADGNQSGAAIAGPDRLWADRPLRRPRRGPLDDVMGVLRA